MGKKKHDIQGKTLSFAAIDIGSNAVRLLIKSIEAGDPPARMRKVQLVRVPLRLGEEAFGEGKISDQKADQLLRLMKAFKQLIKVYGVEGYRACATAAMRDASNGRQIVKHIEAKTKVQIEIIDGLEEARIVYDSHIADLLNNSSDYIYVDVGGGSTEISLIASGELIRSESFNIGTVRILSGKVKTAEWTRMDRYLSELSSVYPNLEIIGSGGNINKLYRLGPDNENRRANYLAVDTLQQLYDRLRGLTVEERIERFGLNRDRADVIVPAAEIFLRISQKTGAVRIYVPTIGITDGIVHTLYQRYIDNYLPFELKA